MREVERERETDRHTHTHTHTHTRTHTHTHTHIHTQTRVSFVRCFSLEALEEMILFAGMTQTEVHMQPFNIRRRLVMMVVVVGLAYTIAMVRIFNPMPDLIAIQY